MPGSGKWQALPLPRRAFQDIRRTLWEMIQPARTITSLTSRMVSLKMTAAKMTAALSAEFPCPHFYPTSLLICRAAHPGCLAEVAAVTGHTLNA